MIFSYVTIEDLCRVEGPDLPHLVIDVKIRELGGGGWEGHAFSVAALLAAGYDVNNRQTPMETQIAAYNYLADILNSLNPPTKAGLCAALGIYP